MDRNNGKPLDIDLGPIFSYRRFASQFKGLTHFGGEFRFVKKYYTHVWYITLLLLETGGTVESNVFVLLFEVMVETYNASPYNLAAMA